VDVEITIPESLSFNSNFLNHVLKHCIVNTEFLRKIRPFLEPKIFKIKERSYLLELVYNYYDEFKQAPMDDFELIFEEEKENISDTLYKKCRRILDNINEIKSSNSEYILNNIHKALKHFAIEEAIVKAAQLCKAKEYDEAKAIFLKALREPDSIKTDFYDFYSDKEYIPNRIEGKNYKFKTLIKPIDNMIGGMNPSWVITILGATKAGKSKFLIELAIASQVQGLNCLFISLEMNKEVIDNAFDQAIGFLGDKPGQKIETMEYKKGQWCKIKMEVPTIYDLDIVRKNRKKLKSHGGKLIISDQTGIKFNYINLEGLIDEIEQTHEIILDIIIVDYLGEMGKTEKQQNQKQKIASNIAGLKMIAKEKNVIMITAEQGNRQAMKSDTFHSNMVADAIEPIWVSDLVLAICQSEDEEKENLYRMFVAEYRHGEKHKIVTLVRDLAIGQIALGEGVLRKKKSKGLISGLEDY
jgi:replicative DNA helicase